MVQTVQQQANDSRCDLDSRLNAAQLMGSPSEWLKTLVQYVKLLCHQQDAGRLTGLCERLLGPLSAPPSGHAGMMQFINSC